MSSTRVPVVCNISVGIQNPISPSRYLLESVYASSSLQALSTHVRHKLFLILAGREALRCSSIDVSAVSFYARQFSSQPTVPRRYKTGRRSSLERTATVCCKQSSPSFRGTIEAHVLHEHIHTRHPPTPGLHPTHFPLARWSSCVKQIWPNFHHFPIHQGHFSFQLEFWFYIMAQHVCTTDATALGSMFFKASNPPAA
jgi:hypothetical protein